MTFSRDTAQAADDWWSNRGLEPLDADYPEASYVEYVSALRPAPDPWAWNAPREWLCGEGS